MSNNPNRRRRAKYAGCEFTNVRGIDVRKLSEDEIREFRRHIAWVMGGYWRPAPLVRKAVV